LDNPGFYTYCSQPKPLERPKYRNNVPKPRGAHDFYNIMWDPHVFRGKPFQPFDQVAEDECLARKKRNAQKKKRLGGIEIPTTPPPELDKRTQTEKFLEELVTNVDEFDACTQTDAIHDMPIPEAYLPAKFGLDVATQIEPCELFDFNRQVCPIVENMVNKILEQALLEVMEEEELEALRDQQRAYEELRRQELLRLKRLAEREQKIQQEQQRLMEQLQEQRALEQDAEDRVGSYLFACNFLKPLLPNTLQSLGQDGFLQNRTELFANLVPWLNKAVTIEVQSSDITRMLLDDIIHDVTNKREREMAQSYFAPAAPVPYYPETFGEGDGE
jgi:hypothetical protein